jgi:hypothetical protein
VPQKYIRDLIKLSSTTYPAGKDPAYAVSRRNRTVRTCSSVDASRESSNFRPRVTHRPPGSRERCHCLRRRSRTHPSPCVDCDAKTVSRGTGDCSCLLTLPHSPPIGDAAVAAAGDGVGAAADAAAVVVAVAVAVGGGGAVAAAVTAGAVAAAADAVVAAAAVAAVDDGDGPVAAAAVAVVVVVVVVAAAAAAAVDADADADAVAAAAGVDTYPVSGVGARRVLANAKASSLTTPAKHVDQGWPGHCPPQAAISREAPRRDCATAGRNWALQASQHPLKMEQRTYSRLTHPRSRRERRC